MKIVTAHGTNNGDASSSGDYWWQRGSAFQKRLARYVTHAKGVEFIPFHWSGENSEQARRNAGDALFKKLRDMEKDGDDDVALIGHSHGGSVLNHALFAASAKGAALDGVKSWITVGTPFIRTARSVNPFNRQGVWGAVTTIAILTFLFLFATVLPLQLAVLQDLWYAATSDDVSRWRFRQLRHYSLGGLNLLFFSVVMPVLIGAVIYRLGSRTRKRLSKRRQRQFADRWLPGWTALNHKDDEAISALKSARAISLNLVPFDAVKKTMSAAAILSVTILFAYVSLMLGGRDTIQRHAPSWMATAEISFKAPGRLVDVAYSPDGAWLATASGDRAARIIDAKTGEVLHLMPHKGRPEALAISEEGDQLLVFGGEGGVIWDVKTGAKIRVISLENAWASNIARLSFSSRRNVILAEKRTTVLNRDGAAVYDATTGAELFELETTNKLGLSDPVFSTSGDVIYAMDNTKDGEIQIFSAKDGTRIDSVFPSFLAGGLPPQLEAHLGLTRGTYDPKSLHDKTGSLNRIAGSEGVLFYYTLAYNDKTIIVQEAFREQKNGDKSENASDTEFYTWVWQDVTGFSLPAQIYASRRGAIVHRYFDGFNVSVLGGDEFASIESLAAGDFWNPIALSPTARQWAVGRPISDTEPLRIVEIGAFPPRVQDGEQAEDSAPTTAVNEFSSEPSSTIITGAPSDGTSRVDYLDKLYYYGGSTDLGRWTGRVQGHAVNQAPDAIQFKPLELREWPAFGAYWSLTTLYARLDRLLEIDNTRIASLRRLTDETLDADYAWKE
ncbi:MAG: hypothetical protein AAGJ87_10710, partial [Pseudomonadota bacterium]